MVLENVITITAVEQCSTNNCYYVVLLLIIITTYYVKVAIVWSSNDEWSAISDVL